MLLALLLQVDPSVASYAQWGIAGALLVLVATILGFVLKALPTWKLVKDGEKEIKLAEIGVRQKEAEARVSEAHSRSQLSEVLNNITVKQHQEVEGMRIMQRVNADSSERMEETVNTLVAGISDLASNVDNISKRLQSLEKAVNSNSDGNKT